MPTYSLPYHTDELKVHLPDTLSTDLILPAHTPSPSNPLELVRQALSTPVGFEWSSVASNDTVAIAINDKTRPVPHEVILPPLLEKLHALGIPDENIVFWIATGTHLPLKAEELPRILPREIIERYAIRSHDIRDESALVFLGKTSYGTDAWVNRSYYEADLKIAVGNIEPHHFAGFSGGMKTAAIGLGGRETINHNHAMLSHPDAWIGRYENNPLRQDIEEIGQLIGVQVAVNVILNQDRDVARVLCGLPRAVMEAGIPFAQQICAVQASADYGLVIASAGGRPKDINFYQAQKALTHASTFARLGAPILLIAACPEGSGNAAYETLMGQLTSCQGIFDYFESHPFQVGPHKALQVARILQRNPVTLVSSMADELVQKLLLTPARSLQATTDILAGQLGPSDKVAILPHATTTLRI